MTMVLGELATRITCLVPVACCFWVLSRAAEPPPLKLETTEDLEAIVFPVQESQTTESVRALFLLEKVGSLVTMAAKLGPAYASNVAATIRYSEFQQPYRDLAKYLDLFGPCQKAQAKGVEGWWSKYTESVSDNVCTEVVKLLAANLLWSQVHYCKQLIVGEVEPKIGGPFPPRPWRLDDPPVKTDWLKAPALYSLADAAIQLGFVKVMASRCPAAPLPLQEDCSQASAELTKMPANRELIGLVIGKVVLRNYERVHLGHLQKLQQDATTK